ncbi:MAG: hypothetical protein J0I29_12600 [Rhizobiales bacterium]|nr:hypothetical protein [Hyphomicrobiales bacterium]
MPRKPISAGRDRTEYRFKIDAYTPDTIPMARLSEYMAQLALLLGEQTAVHFHKLTKGSTILNARVEREAAPKVRDRIARVRTSDAPAEPMKAYAALNKLLRDDNAIGVLRDDSPRGIVIRFPGRELALEKFPTIRQQGSIDGIVTGIRGRDATAHVILQSEGQQLSGCEIRDRALAKQLAAKYLEPVRLFGRGRWTRDADGVWQLENFKVESFDALDDSSLSKALDELRALPLEWDEHEFDHLETDRNGPGGKRNGGH